MTAVLYFETIVLYVETAILYVETAVLYVETAILYVETVVLYEETAILYVETVVLYVETAVLYMETIVLYVETAILYVETTVLYVETTVLYVQTAVLYVQTAVLYVQTAVLNMETAVLYVETAVLYVETVVLYVETVILYVETAVLYVETAILYVETAVLYVETAILYVETAVLYVETVVLYVENVVLYVETAILYVETVVLYVETAVLYMKTIVLYVETAILYVETAVLYVETAILYVETVVLYEETAQAAGIYGHMKDVVLSHVQQDPTPDLNPDTLNALVALMLAQAQEAIYRKAASDKMKDSMVAKIAFQLSDLFADAMKLMQLQSLRELWPKDWIATTVMKQAAFHGMAEYYQSCVAAEKKCYGEQISRLQHANELLCASQTRGGTVFCFKNELARVNRDLQAAKKDNDFIYHDKVPDVKSLPAIGKAVIAKPIPFTNKPMSERFTDLFSKLVPIPVFEAMTAFDNRKGQIVNAEIGRLRESTQLMNSVLASLNLPAAIEDLSGNKVPQSVLDKAAQIKQEGGMQYIDKLMRDLPELLQRNREILDEATRELEEEEASDKKLREQFKEKWSRTPSDKLTNTLKEECTKYKSILDAAIGADRIVQEKYSTHKEAIALLSKPQADLERSIPSSGGGSGQQSSQAIQSLRQMMEEVETMKAERDVMESEIKDATFDMTGKFLSAMAAEGLINEESISVAELDRTFGPLRQQVTTSVQNQELLLGKIQNANTQFCHEKASSQGGAQRESLLKDLASGFDMYMQLKGNLEEGTKFYNDLTPLLVKLQSKIHDFCFARKTEKDELMSDLQKSIVKQPSAAAPAAPSYQQPTSGAPYGETSTSRVPPPRPPPPSFSSAPTQPPTTAPAGTQPSGPSAPPSQPPAQNYNQQGGWGAPPYGQQQDMSRSMPAMPSGFNPYNPYMGQQYQPPPYQGQQQQYPGQQYPGQQQQYPGQPQYPQQQQQYPGGQPPYPQQQQPYPGQQQYPGYPNQQPGQPPYPQNTQWR
ncbi:LOW QUALITY PROTEIN: programmed cell death 6-interacting protein-like [Argopecten irradians]|uniref:LOW QUALITY PROTEIN: programmed cell death 6-interacting protein-like n=1 Tax=Argopecten irradians TaxID=31199 RepID=UPI003720A50A